MRVAATYDNGNIFMHFGRSEQFKIYDIQDGKVLNEQVVGTGGTGHGALAGLLANGGVDTLICGGIGGGAINALTQAGITVHAGAQGSCDACVEALIAGTLAQTGEATCDCHGHASRAHPRAWRVLWLPRSSRARGPRRLRLPLAARHRRLGARH